MGTRERSPGQTLKDLRIAKGWSQAKLAVRSGVAPGTVVRAEKDGPIREITQERIARRLGVDRRDIWPEEAKAS